MVYQGTIQNGVVVLPNGVSLPEGTPVRVEPLVEPRRAASAACENDPLLNMNKFAVDMGPADLSVNIDHYLYGHPKVIDGQ
jgi:hypothetical protein